MTGPVQRNSHVTILVGQLPHTLLADPTTALARPRRVGDLNVRNRVEQRAVESDARVGVDDADASDPVVDAANELDGVVSRLCVHDNGAQVGIGRLRQL